MTPNTQRADQPDGAAERHAHRAHYARNQEIAAIITYGNLGTHQPLLSSETIESVSYRESDYSSDIAAVRLTTDSRIDTLTIERPRAAEMGPPAVKILERVNELLPWKRPRFEVRKVAITPDAPADFATDRERALSLASDADWSRYRPAEIDQAEVNRRVSLAVRHIVEAFGLVPTDAVSIDITPGAVVVTTFEPHSAETGEHSLRGDDAATTVVGSTWQYIPNGRKKPATPKED